MASLEEILPEEATDDKGQVVWKRSDSFAAKKYKDPVQLARGYDELEKAYSSSVRIPGDKASPDEIAEFHKKLGCPEKDSEYEFTTVEGLPSDEALQTKVRQWAFKNGLGKTPIKELSQMVLDHQVEQVKAGTIQGDNVWPILQKHYGSEFEQAKDEVSGVFSQIEEENPALLKSLNEDWAGYEGKRLALADHPSVHSLLRIIAQLTKEDNGGRVPLGGGGGDSLESLKTKIEDIRADKNLTDAEKGRRLIPLYEQRVAAEKAKVTGR